MLVHEFYSASEWPFRDALLRAEIYDQLLVEVEAYGRLRLAGLLSEDDWMQLLNCEMFESFPWSEGGGSVAGSAGASAGIFSSPLRSGLLPKGPRALTDRIATSIRELLEGI